MHVMRFRTYQHPDHPEGPAQTDLTVLPADRMRAERLSTTELPPSQRGPGSVKANPETWVLLWLWCSATRTHLTTAGFTEWAETLLDYDRLTAAGELADDDTDPDEVAEPVDPTQPVAPTS